MMNFKIKVPEREKIIFTYYENDFPKYVITKCVRIKNPYTKYIVNKDLTVKLYKKGNNIMEVDGENIP